MSDSPRNRTLWLRGLAGSQTGRRLRLLTRDDLTVCYDVSPWVSSTVSGVEQPDVEWTRTILTRARPRLVVACGRVVENFLHDDTSPWPTHAPLIAIPHPGRAVSNALLNHARDLVDGGFTGRVALRQRKGIFTAELL
jgi:hypothetical protein